MNCAEASVLEAVTECKQTLLCFPVGLLGFEQVKRYVLQADPSEAPFAWLQMAEEPNLSFVVILAGHVMETYHPEVSRDDAEFLGLSTAEDGMLLAIVTLHEDGRATANLKGPLVVNRHTLVAKQVLPANAAAYSSQHPLNIIPT